MSWNKQTLPTNVAPKKKILVSPWLKVGLPFLILALVAGLVYIIFTDDGKGESKNGSDRQISKIEGRFCGRNAPKVSASDEVHVSTNLTDKNSYKKRLYTNEQGVVIFKGKPLPYSRRCNRPKRKHEIFETHAENTIAELLTVEPGTMFIGTPIFGERFKKEFLKSCEVPIIISKDDDDFTQQLKRDMIQTKIELRQRMAEGEDLGEIISSSRKELQRLGMVKQEIKKMIQDESKAAKSEEDIEDLISAANTMLAGKGIAPLQATPILKRSLMRHINRD